MTHIAVLDDWQGVAKDSADWSRLEQRGEVVFFETPFERPEDIAPALVSFRGCTGRWLR